MTLVTIGIDVGKNWFHLIGLDSSGLIVTRQRFNRVHLLRFMSKLQQPCVVGMEASCGSHHLARELSGMGFGARLMSAKFVRPFLKGNKNDYLDAEAIAEAVQRPSMRFVPIKTIEQLDLQAIHRTRSGLISRRTGVINQIRSFLQDRGVTVPQGPAVLARTLPALLRAEETRLSESIKQLIVMLQEQWVFINRQVAQLELELRSIVERDDACKRLASIPGIGAITASAIVAAIGDGRMFRSGRDFAAWLGLVPRQHSTGGRSTLLGISKRGNAYIRTLLIHGSRCMLRFFKDPDTAIGRWAVALKGRAHANVAAVALANKQARTAWALLTQGTFYQARPAV
jgi:transposase